MEYMLTIGPIHYLGVGTVLFILGMMGLCLNRRNVLLMLMSLEILLLAISLNFVAFSVYLSDILGQVFVFFILTVGAAETAIGLSLFVVFFRHKGTLSIQSIDNLKG